MVFHMSSSLSVLRSTHGTCANTWVVVWVVLSCVFNPSNLSEGVEKNLNHDLQSRVSDMSFNLLIFRHVSLDRSRWNIKYQITRNER